MSVCYHHFALIKDAYENIVNIDALFRILSINRTGIGDDNNNNKSSTYLEKNKPIHV
jgi:hypothetical protein